jgi:hypothetical protein
MNIPKTASEFKGFTMVSPYYSPHGRCREAFRKTLPDEAGRKNTNIAIPVGLQDRKWRFAG